MTLDAGSMIGGRYRVVRLLGGGGMAEVYEGVHLGLDERVAIKRLNGDVLEVPTMVERFFREAQTAARLKTEHAVRILDVGVGEDKTPYMIMELLTGKDLTDCCDVGVPFETAVDYVIQTADALAEAHALGIVHRDVKPANLFLADQPDGAQVIKVLDFGISKAKVGARKLTATDSTFGTPMYMSPEQMRSAHATDYRSDIWSLGVVLYELIEGTSPFGGGTYAEIVLRVSLDKMIPMVKAVPPGLVRVIERCLAKAPADRWQTMGAMMESLVPYAHDSRKAWQCTERSARLATKTAELQSMPRPSATPSVTPASSAHQTTIPLPAADPAEIKLRDARKRLAQKPLIRPTESST